MANTTYLKKTVEAYLRDWAAAELGAPLVKRKVEVGRKLDGNPAYFEFDGVSQDGRIGVVISASLSYKSGQKLKYFMEATLLNRVPDFDRRVMLFITEDCWLGFKKDCDGRVDLNRIEPLICTSNNMPPEMRSGIEAIYTESAKEVGDKSGPGRIAKR